MPKQIERGPSNAGNGTQNPKPADQRRSVLPDDDPSDTSHLSDARRLKNGDEHPYIRPPREKR